MIISPFKEIKGSKFDILPRKRKGKREKGEKGHALLTKVHEELASMNIYFTSHKEYTNMSILEARDLVGKI